MNPALEYAEKNLGVHTVYEEAEAARVELDEVIGELDKAQDTRRSFIEQIADREMELAIQERGKHPDMPVTRMDEHVKHAKRKDQTLVNLRDALNGVQSRIAGLEYDADILKHTIRIRVARMEELGGYFHYLAAIKQAENLAKTYIVSGA